MIKTRYFLAHTLFFTCICPLVLTRNHNRTASIVNNLYHFVIFPEQIFFHRKPVKSEKPAIHQTHNFATQTMFAVIIKVESLPIAAGLCNRIADLIFHLGLQHKRNVMSASQE